MPLPMYNRCEGNKWIHSYCRRPQSPISGTARITLLRAYLSGFLMAPGPLEKRSGISPLDSPPYVSPDLSLGDKVWQGGERAGGHRGGYSP